MLLRMNCRTVTQLIALATVLSQSAGELISKPRNTESKVGETTYFNCSTDLTHKEIFWYHGDRYIYTGDAEGIVPPYQERFEIDRNASIGSHNLVIHSVQPSDKGKYVCIDDEGIGTRKSAELVVLEDDPYCRSNIQPEGVIGQNIFNITQDEVQLTCNVTYHGNIPPQMEWKKVGEYRPITDNVQSNISSNNNYRTYNLKLKGDIALDKSSFVCQTTRSAQNQYKCASEAIKVLYFIGAETTEENVLRGDMLTCTTSNYTFACISQWYHDNYTCPLSCDEKIKTHLLGEYLCKVKCNVRGKDYFFQALKAFVAEAPTSPPPSKSAAIAASVLIPIVIIILVVLVAAYIVRERKRKDEQKKKHIIRQNIMDEAEIEWQPPVHIVNNRRKGKKPLDKVAEEEIEIIHKLQQASNTMEKTIRGVTIFDEKLFIVRKISSDLEIYSFGNFNQSPNFHAVPDLYDAVDICSCKKYGLYILDKKGNGAPKEIISIGSDREVKIRWPTEDNAGGFLSATTEGNVIVTVLFQHKLLEYSSEGEKVRSIKLSRDINPWHALKVADDLYIVSHGTAFDYEHKVCLVNKDGKIEKSFGREIGPADNQLNKPYYLAVAGSLSLDAMMVIVADMGNNRVLLLDGNMELKMKPLPKYKHGFKNPRRVYMDEEYLVVVIAAGEPRQTIPVEAANPMEGAAEGQPPKENSGFLKDAEMEMIQVYPQMMKVDIDNRKEADVPENRIETDCRLLVFDIKPLLRKCNVLTGQ